MLDEGLAALAGARGDLGQPDGGLDGLDLAEERPDVAERVVTPVFQQAGGLGSDLPAGFGQLPPAARKSLTSRVTTVSP